MWAGPSQPPRNCTRTHTHTRMHARTHTHTYAHTNVCLTRVLVSSHTQHTHTHTHTHTQIKRLPGLGSFGHFRHSNSSHLLHHHYLYPRLLLLYGLLQHRRLRRPVCEGPAQKCAAPSMTSVVCGCVCVCFCFCLCVCVCSCVCVCVCVYKVTRWEHPLECPRHMMSLKQDELWLLKQHKHG